MAKYSTGGGTGDSGGGACELCGTDSDSLTDATIAGASLSVCRECAPHDDRGAASKRSDTTTRNTGRKAAQHAAKMADAATNDPDYWVEHGTEYEEDQLPYLISGYGDIVRSARQEAGYTLEELAEELAIPVEDLDAVEQRRATRAGVGGSVITALEEELEIRLTEDT